MPISKIGNKALGAGTVLQVVASNSSTFFSTSSGTFVSTGISATITPTSATSKILACVTGPFDSQGATNQGVFTFYRGGVDIVTGSSSGNGFGNVYGAASRIISTVSGIILDSPAATSATTYTLYIRASGGTPQWGTTGNTLITLMEIAA
jgi:hypothetical protein